MTTEDDARDLAIHSRIESALRFLTGPGRKLSRADGLGALKACALNAGNAHLNHMIEAITVNMDLTREELADRIQAVLELDAEEQAARERDAIRKAIMAEEGAS